jgi:hypothetical protein
MSCPGSDLIGNRNERLGEGAHKCGDPKTPHEQDQEIPKFVSCAGFFLDLPEKFDIAKQNTLVTPEIKQVNDHWYRKGCQSPEKLRVQKLHKRAKIGRQVKVARALRSSND